MFKPKLRLREPVGSTRVLSTVRVLSAVMVRHSCAEEERRLPSYRVKQRKPKLFASRVLSSCYRNPGSDNLGFSLSSYARTGMARVRVALALGLVVSTFGIASLATITSPAPASAATSNTINFQARLMNSSGSIVPDGTYNVEFKLYNASGSTGSSQGSCTGDANCLWTETRTGATNAVSVSDGYLTVNLGSVNALPTNIWNQQLWLSMRIGGSNPLSPVWDTEMTPKLQLTAVPAAYALTNYNGGISASLSLQAPTVGDQTFSVLNQGAAGSYNICVQGATSALGGCAPTSGGTGYIQNQNSGAQSTSNFWISGTGRADTALQSPSLDVATAGALGLGTGTATSVSLGKAGITTTNNGALTVTQAFTANGGGSFSLATGKQVTVTATAAPTIDQLAITNAGQAVTAAGGGVNNLSLNFVGGAVASENGSLRIDLQPGGTSGGTWNGVRFVANGTGPATGVTENGVKLEGPGTTGGAGTYNGININNIGTTVAGGTVRGINITATNSNAAGTVRAIQLNNITAGTASEIGIDLGTGWDNLLTYNNGATVIVNGSGQLNLGSVTGTLAAGNGGTGSAFTQFSGPTTSVKTFTLPDASATILTSNAAVTAAQGGTGITSYTIGDLLYASGAATLSKLADVATGSCLISGGVGVAPSWGACGSGSSGTLQNAYDNSASPATITSSSAAKTITLQSGATFNTTRFFEIVANGVAAPVLSVDTANQRVGINMSTPGYALDVTGDVNASLTFKVAGTTVCDSTGCSAKPGGGNYIRNATAQQTNSNFNIKSGNAGQTTAQLTGSDSATVPVAVISSGATPGAAADLLQLTDGTNVLAKFSNAGVLTLGRAGAGTTGSIILNNSTNANAITLMTGATSTPYNLVLPASAGNSGDCLKNGGTGGTLTFAACGSTGITTTLQNAYDNSSSPATITTSAAGKGIGIIAGTVPTADLLTITNSGQPITANAVNGMSIGYFTAITNGANEDAAFRIDQTITGTTAGTTNGFRFVASSTGPATTVTNNGVKLEGPTTGSAGTYNAINLANIGAVASGGTVRGINITATNSNAAGTVRGIQLNNVTGGGASEIGIDLGTGWDNLLTYNNGASVIINGSGQLNLGQVTGTLAAGNGGTGNAFTQFSGPATSTKTFTLPNASATILTTNAAVTAAQGGTGITSYAVGDLLYAGTTSSLSKLADVASGSCLVSGGVGVAPTWGACGGGGSASTLQDAYTNSTGGTTPEILLDSTRGALTVRDTSGGLGTNLLEVQNNAGTRTYFGVSASGVTVQNATGDAFKVLTSGTPELRVYDSSATNYASISYSAGAAVFAASSGTTQIGNGGSVTGNLTGATDVYSFNTTLTAAAAYSQNNFSVQRTLTGGANTLGGSLINITDSSTANAGVAINPTLLLINQASSVGTISGNLLDAQLAGTSKFKVTTAGAVTAASTLTVSAGGIAVTGNSTINGTLSSLTGLTSSGTITFSGLSTNGVVTVSGGALSSTATLGASNGGTGNAFTAFSGPATSIKTFTLPNASATILTTNAAVTAAQGGTGQSSYAVGDLLFASTTSALSRLADVASGSCLISGGVNVAPQWGACGAGGGISGVTTIDTAGNTGAGIGISGSNVYLQSATASFGGIVNNTTQTFGGVKTFAGGFTVNGVAVLQETTAPAATAGYGKLYVSSSDHALHLLNASGVDTALGAGGGGGSHTKRIVMVPEYSGAIFSADGSNNTGYMTPGYVSGLTSGQGYKHNYYAWTTDQATAQDYDIVVQYQIPSDYSSFSSGTWKIWTYADTLTSTAISWTVKDIDGTTCYASTQSVKPSSAATWQQVAISDPANGCTFAANDIITLDIQPSAITPVTNQVRIGELQFDYSSAY